jgi:hypothetical protein
MNKLEFEKQIKLNKTAKELANFFGKSITTIRYWLQKWQLQAFSKCKRNVIIDGFKVCSKCHINKSINNYTARGKSKYRGACKLCTNTKINRQTRNNKNNILKQKLVTFKGGKCEICSIKTVHTGIYDFHHKDPSLKEYSIGTKRHSNIEKYKNEIDKCHLLCSNCHREVHGGLHPNYLITPEQPGQPNHNLVVERKICFACKINKPLSLYYKGDKTECKECRCLRSTMRIRNIKAQCFKYKGGKCEHCNYDKYIGAIDFHHIDPSKKDFNIAQSQKTFGDYYKKELDKCICLCSNCHRIEHARLFKLQNTQEKDKTTEQKLRQELDELKKESTNEINQLKDEVNQLKYTLKKESTDEIDQLKDEINQLKNELRMHIKNNKKEEVKIKKHSNCQDCNKNITLNSLRCNNCSKINRRKVKNRPPKSQLQDEVNKMGYCATGRKYGVSDNAIRKWMK